MLKKKDRSFTKKLVPTPFSRYFNAREQAGKTMSLMKQKQTIQPEGAAALYKTNPMKPKPYTVHIVIAPNYGKRLRDLPKGEPAWILDTPINRQACQGNSSEDTPNSHLVGYTFFKHSTADSPGEMLLSLLENIELHHGELSHDPPYSILNVIGVKWSGNLANGLAEFGFAKHKETIEGFITKKVTG